MADAFESPPTDPGTLVAGLLAFDCPRCGTSVEATYWGPCATCRDDLAAASAREARDVAVAEYGPKMNVTPNQVATKD